MKLLVEVKQTDLVLKTFLLPLANLSFVDEIHVVRDVRGPAIPKVCYYPTGGKRGTSRAFKKCVKMYSLARKVNPDVIIAVDVYPHFFNGYLAAKRFKKPLLMSLRGELVNNPLRPDNPFMNGLLIKMLKRTDVITVTGKKIKQYVVNKGVSSKKVHVVPVSIDTTNFVPGKDKKDIDIITVARISPEKRLDRFLETVRLCAKKNKNLKAVIVGDGPELEKLKRIAQDLGVQKNVRFVGFQKDTSKFLQRAKIFLLTSETEGLPQAIIEALSCGVPVVAPAIGDITDAATSKNAIIVADKSDVGAYVHAVQKLLSNEVLRKKLAKHATSIRDDFSFASAEKMYRRLLKKWISR